MLSCILIERLHKGAHAFPRKILLPELYKYHTPNYFKRSTYFLEVVIIY